MPDSLARFLNELGLDKLISELTPARLIYDLTLAAIPGLIAGLVVNAFIQRREQQRWQPARNAVYASLLTVLNSLLGEIVPPGFLVPTGVQFISFGAISISSSLDFDLKDRNHLSDVIQTRSKSALSYDLAPLQHGLADIDQLLASSPPLLEAEPMNLLLHLHKTLQECIDGIRPELLATDEFQRTNLGAHLSLLFYAVIPLRSFLDQRITQRQTLEEYSTALNKTIEQITSKHTRGK